MKEVFVMQAEYVVEKRGRSGEIFFTDASAIKNLVSRLDLKKGETVAVMVEYSVKPVELKPIVKDLKKLRGFKVDQSGLILTISKS